MSWDYRVVRKRYEQTGDQFYAIHEVFFDEEDRAWGCTKEAVTPMAESLEDLVKEVLGFVQALFQANEDCDCGCIVDYDLIPEQGAVNPADERLDADGELVGDTIPWEEITGWKETGTKVVLDRKGALFEDKVLILPKDEELRTRVLMEIGERIDRNQEDSSE